jgi:hypothetical protein
MDTLDSRLLRIGFLATALAGGLASRVDAADRSVEQKEYNTDHEVVTTKVVRVDENGKVLEVITVADPNKPRTQLPEDSPQPKRKTNYQIAKENYTHKDFWGAVSAIRATLDSYRIQKKQIPADVRAFAQKAYRTLAELQVKNDGTWSCDQARLLKELDGFGIADKWTYRQLVRLQPACADTVSKTELSKYLASSK